jgi:hypothetical protein
MLGWDSGSWGLHSDDGRLYGDGQISHDGVAYSYPFTTGDVIGCGVNFAEKCAFFTCNGLILGQIKKHPSGLACTNGGSNPGQAFYNIRGKVYPAVSFDIRQPGWEISAVFPGADGTSTDFAFRGNLQDSELVEKLRPGSHTWWKPC